MPVTTGLDMRFNARVVIVPSRQLWLGDSEARSAASRIHNAMIAGARNRGIFLIDPREAFEADGNPLRFHFARDGHWTAAGHMLVARILLEAR